MPKELKIPEATIERISIYSRPLEDLLEQGVLVVSSKKLAGLCKVNPAQVRKDFSYFGEFGVRGIGYGVRDLLLEIKKILVSDREWSMGMVGMGNMGMSLVKHENFLRRGYKFVAVFDSDPENVGKRLPSGLTVQPLTEIGETVKSLGIIIGVIATQPSEAQAATDLFVKAGVKALLNFSPIQVRQPENCLVKNVDFTVTLNHLAYHLNRID